MKSEEWVQIYYQIWEAQIIYLLLKEHYYRTLCFTDTANKFAF